MSTYIVEIEIYEHEARKTAVLTMERKVVCPVQEGHLLIINDGWHRIASVVHDTDHDKCYLHLERIVVTENEFQHTIKGFQLKGWILFGGANAVENNE